MHGLNSEILRLLQIDATQSLADIAEQIGLSTTACWRRIQALEKQGIIDKRIFLLEPEKNWIKYDSICTSQSSKT